MYLLESNPIMTPFSFFRTGRIIERAFMPKIIYIVGLSIVVVDFFPLTDIL